MTSKEALEMLKYLTLKNVPKQVIAEFLDLQIREIKNLKTCNCDLENKELTKVIRIKEWLENERISKN